MVPATGIVHLAGNTIQANIWNIPSRKPKYVPEFTKKLSSLAGSRAFLSTERETAPF